MLDVLMDTAIDGIKLLPFLLITYIIMEYIEHKTGEKAKKVIQKSGKFGPLWGGILGIFPQCGFSAAAANLYAGKIITLGTLIAIFLSTSDEMLPVLISEAAPIGTILEILGIKLVIGIIVGFLIDIVGRAFKKKKEESPSEEAIGEICEHEHCHCEEEGIFLSALKHTLHIFIFILLVTLALNMVIYFMGEETLANIILNKPIIGPIIAAIVGFIPNCAGSVIITKLYLSQVISMGSMIAGLLVGSGIGILVLFKVNKNIKENIKIAGILYAVGVLFGILIDWFL
ncbi:MAG: putative manganese transporter [Clostridia bacterium]